VGLAAPFFRFFAVWVVSVFQLVLLFVEIEARKLIKLLNAKYFHFRLVVELKYWLLVQGL
jgi:hypothetical protein